MPAHCESCVALAYHSARGMRISALCCSVLEPFVLYFLRNERLLIAFLVSLICYMVLPHYCVVHLK